MPDKPLSAPRHSFVQYMADSGSETFNNAAQSYKRAYPKCNGGWNRLAARLMAMDVIKQAISKYKAKTTAKLDHNRTIAIKLLNENIAALDAIIEAQPNNVAAVTARTGAIRELNAISMLHGSNLVVAAESPVDVPDADLDQVAAEARAATLKLA